jgi:NTE family protein
MKSPKTVAVACQGGGSHCAFGAGVLIELLSRTGDGALILRGGETLRLAGFSGTSGGAINALLAWYGIVSGNCSAGVLALEGVWRDLMATNVWDAFGNAAMVSAARLQGVVPSIEIAPNAFSNLAQQNLGALIGKHVPFHEFEILVGEKSPDLYVGAANVLSGAFTVFGGAGRRSVLSVEHILASAAVPELFPPVRIGDEYYWDGLLSQNPPISNFLRGREKSSIPDEIWIIRINPVARRGLPTRLNDIRDRRNEMAGNLAIKEETTFIHQVNAWVQKGLLPDKKHVAVREISLEHCGSSGDGLDYASKLDRDPAFIEGLLQRGRAAAIRFMDGAEA